MALQGWRERWAGARSWLDHAGPCAPSGLGVLERSSGPHLRARTLASVGGWTEGARTRAGKESLGLGWVGQQTPFLSRVSPDSAGAPPLQDLPAASSPRAPRAGGGARRRGALPGWSPPPPTQRLRCLAANPAARLRVICRQLSQWEGVAETRSLFLGLRPPPRQCCRHLEPRRVSRAGSCSRTRDPLRLGPAPPRAAAAHRRRCASASAPKGPTDSYAGPALRGPRPTYGGAKQIMRTGGAPAPHPLPYGWTATPRGATPGLRIPRWICSTPGERQGTRKKEGWDWVQRPQVCHSAQV